VHLADADRRRADPDLVHPARDHRVYAQEVAEGKRFANALSEPTGGNLFLIPLQKAERGTRSQLLSFTDTVLREEHRCVRMVRGEPNIIALGLSWLSIGVAEATLEALTEHARTRVVPTTGKPLAELQWVTFDTADVHTELLAARLLCERSMFLADIGDPAAMDAAVEAKLYANQVAKRVADLGLRVGGGSGFLRTSPIQRHFRDAQAGALMAYSVEVCRDTVGKRVLG
jgi:alkylation response protein AidB-like acyl-CoA dehydrogenase